MYYPRDVLDYNFRSTKLKHNKRPSSQTSYLPFKYKQMLNDGKAKRKLEDDTKDIYLSIDHLNDGNYIFNIMLDDKVVKSFKLKK